MSDLEEARDVSVVRAFARERAPRYLRVPIGLDDEYCPDRRHLSPRGRARVSGWLAARLVALLAEGGPRD